MVHEATLLPCDIWHAHNGICNDRVDDARTLVLQLGFWRKQNRCCSYSGELFPGTVYGMSCTDPWATWVF